jgi:hypothetical protein
VQAVAGAAAKADKVEYLYMFELMAYLRAEELTVELQRCMLAISQQMDSGKV